MMVEQAEGVLPGQARSGGRWIGPTVAVVAVVTLVAIALSRGPSTFDPTSPEGAVQDYLGAVSESRWEDAYAILDPVAFENCEPSDIAAVGEQEFTAVHDGTETTGSNALVSVRLRFGDTGPLGSGWEQPEQFVLIESEGFWYITQEPWPYFRFSCEQF
jgi:hypothetical protein